VPRTRACRDGLEARGASQHKARLFDEHTAGCRQDRCSRRAIEELDALEIL